MQSSNTIPDKQSFNELSANEKVTEILRWLAVIPAAIIGGFVAHLITIIGNSPQLTQGMINPDESVMDKLLVVVLSNVVLGVCVVLAGVFTAPRFHKATAIVLATSFVTVSGFVLLILLQRPTPFWDYIAVITGALSAIGAAYYVCQE